MTNGDTRSCINQILNAIEYGRLSIEETEGRAQNLLNNEIAQTNEAAHMGMVNACQSLDGESATSVSSYTKAWVKPINKLDK